MEPIIGHGAIVRELAQIAAAEEPPHAVLFVGPEGVGRVRLAIEYGLLLNCQAGDASGPGMMTMLADPAPPGPDSNPAGRPCGVCRSCRLIGQGSHPDVVQVGPGDTLCRPRNGESSHTAHPQSRDIRICQVRGMVDLASRYPVEAKQRLIIVDPADRMNRDASNALLKTLEEPPGHTVFALISSAPEILLETIVSRCRRIDVGPVARTEIEAGLIARGVEPARAAEAATESHGRPGRAIEFAGQPDLMEIRGRLLARCEEITAASLGKRFSYANDLNERWRKDRSAVGVELDAWETYWESRLQDAARAHEFAYVRSSMASLAAITQARADLQAQVIPRGAFELMMLSFAGSPPRSTLDRSEGNQTPAHAI